MTHDELIEVAARSLWIAHGFNPAHWDGTTGGQWAAYMVSQKPHYLNLARAAISVIAPDVLDEAAKEADEYAVFHDKHDDGLSGFDYMASGAREVAENIRALKTRYE